MRAYLEEYQKRVYPFHMPGHKLGRLNPLGSDVYRIDVTEVEGTDNLHQPEGIIRDVQNLAKRLYGADETKMLVNGSSCGLLAAISACCEPEGKIIVARNCHKSVYHGLVLNRLSPVYLYPMQDLGLGLLGGITPDQVEKALQENPDAACVLITSPTYEGFISDIKGIADIVHHYNKLLIVDEAHGAHLRFSDRFPKSALDQGADVVVQSLHKTLPALTQSALIHFKGHLVPAERIKEYLMIYQTSSPSYVLMAGMEACLEFIDYEGKAYYKAFFDKLDCFYNEMANLKRLKLVGPEVVGTCGIHQVDPSKLTFVGRTKPINGKSVDRVLREQFQIQVEMSTMTSVTGISTLADTDGFELLTRAMKAIDGMDEIFLNKLPNIGLGESLPILRCTPYTAFIGESLWIEIKDAAGTIASSWVTLYPPGIPILGPGEEVTQEILDQLLSAIEQGLVVLGIEDGKIKIMRGSIK